MARFEETIERVVERIFTRAARSRLQPVEIGKRLVRAMEAQQSVGIEGVLVPNVYDVYLHPDDYARFQPMRRSLCQNMATHLGRVARQEGYHLVSRPVVNLRERARLERGEVQIEASMADVASDESVSQHTSVMPAVGGQLPPSRAVPNLVIDGRSHPVLRSPTRVGRLPDNDIVINDRRVSRHHAELAQRGNRWLLRDAGSTNGTAVNDKVVREASLRPGDRISLGGFEVTWEQ